MSEERMIRFDEKDWDELMQWLDEVAEFISNSELKDTPAHAPIWIQVIENTTFEENAVASPKNFEPRCRGVIQCNRCQLECPYRKKRE
jgi:hypothetical protein